MRRLVQGGALLLGVACGGSEFFVCNDDDDCAGAGAGGVCQPVGACSVPDDVCDSGQRYVEGSQPSVAGECVPGETSTSGEETGPPPSTSGDTSEPSGCPEEWWDCAWAHRQRVQMVRAAEVQLEVPVLVLLRAGRVDHERMQADGEDLRFVSATGEVADYEIERWDPEGVSVVWVHLDALGGPADHLWMYYGNPVAEGAQDPAAVWAEPYVGVWHLEDAMTLDATANANDAVADGNTSVELGQIGNGRDFGGGEPRLQVEPDPSLDDVFVGGATISTWIRLRGWGQNGFGRIANKVEGDASWELFVEAGGRLWFGIAWDVDVATGWHTPYEELSLQRWTHVAVTYDLQGSMVPRFFVDGVERPLDDPSPQPLVEMPTSDAEVPVLVGNRPGFDRDFYGRIDELRIERTIRSPAWIRMQVESMRDELLEFGPIETREEP